MNLMVYKQVKVPATADATPGTEASIGSAAIPTIPSADGTLRLKLHRHFRYYPDYDLSEDTVQEDKFVPENSYLEDTGE